MSVPPRRVRKARMASATAATGFDDLLVGERGLLVPLPCVLEGGDLGGGAGAVFLGEEDVVVLAGVEGRIEVDEVDGLDGDVVAEDGEVVAVEELVEARDSAAGPLGIMLAALRAVLDGTSCGSRTLRVKAKTIKGGEGGVAGKCKGKSRFLRCAAE